MCQLYAIWCPALKYAAWTKQCPVQIPIDAIMLCIYLACHHRKRFIVLFRLADWLALSWTAPFQRYLWVTVLPNSSQTATWTPGNWVLWPSSLWATSRLPGLFRTSWRAKGPSLEFSLSHKGDNPGPLEQPTSHIADRAEEEASRSSVSSIKRK